MKILVTTLAATITLLFAVSTFASDEPYDEATCVNIGMKCGPKPEPEAPEYVPVSCAENPRQRQCVVPEKEVGAILPEVPFLERTCTEERNLRALNLIASKINRDGQDFLPESFEVWGGIGTPGGKARESVVVHPNEPIVIGYCVLAPSEYEYQHAQWEVSVVSGGVTAWITPEFTVSATPVNYFEGLMAAENYIDIPEFMLDQTGFAQVFLTVQVLDLELKTVGPLTIEIIAVPII